MPLKGGAEMPRPKKTAAEREVMRQRILLAASNLLERYGSEGVNIRAVTAGLGVSPMAFYSYFSSRDELLNTLSEWQLRIMQESIDQFLARARQEGAERVLREVVHLFARVAFDQPRSYLLQWAMPLEEPREGCLHQQRFETVLRFLTSMVELGIQQGDFQSIDPNRAALVIFSMFNGPLLLHTSGRLPDADQLSELLIETEKLAILYLTGKADGKTTPAA